MPDSAEEDERQLSARISHSPRSDYGTLNRSRSAWLDFMFQKKENQEATQYDIHSLSTLRVFMQFRGTVLWNDVLWGETLVMAVLYWTIFGAVLYLHQKQEHLLALLGEESSIRAFIGMFSALIGLLLSFYTALNLQRWWDMRQQVHQITEASKQLTMFLSAGVTRDGPLLERVHRYPRASLCLIFAASASPENGGTPLEMAQRGGLLTREEGHLLTLCGSENMWVHAETIWTWLANAISRLNDQGLTKGPPHYCMLMQSVEKGRAAIADIHAYLETPIPKGYVHLLCLMVKIHNIIVTVLMAGASVMHQKESHTVGLFRTTFRAFFMPFLYNAILVLNAEVTDPFGQDDHDFPFWQFSDDMEASGNSYLLASKDVPEELSGKKAYEKVFVKPEVKPEVPPEVP